MRAAVYVRMSQDRTGAGLGLGLERQEQDCRKLCDRLSWKVAGLSHCHSLFSRATRLVGTYCLCRPLPEAGTVMMGQEAT